MCLRITDWIKYMYSIIEKKIQQNKFRSCWIVYMFALKAETLMRGIEMESNIVSLNSFDDNIVPCKKKICSAKLFNINQSRESRQLQHPFANVTKYYLLPIMTCVKSLGRSNCDISMVQMIDQPKTQLPN